ncbi:39S ribosomal protein L37, mitochondrial-like isoform X2 [Patiria miniata]|uniref:Large ribosomal subunit protein mL37 n=1 Tax=Patiria miniata TaxID=46514 RepID=A0A914APT4_PATMI|nr:39S ribosomal protein L37, mitochondrial-like isoform X1 [Patiria miniata]XP_038066045.1 39S ribosomal protein L37, mitochondrial-like isoform X2 [Patiria miniata]
MALFHTTHQAATILTRCLPAVSSQLLFHRGYRPEVLKRGIEKNKQKKKPLHRVVEEMLGLEPAIEQPPRVELPNNHPQYSNRVDFGPENPHYHDDVAYLFTHDVSLQEGVKQALWLTKSKLMGNGQMPNQIQDLTTSLEIPDMDQKVEQSIRQCRQYDTVNKFISMKRYSFTTTMALIRLCSLLGPQYPEILSRAQAPNYYVSASWTRENNVIQVRGRPGMLMTSKNPLQPLAGLDEIQQTSDHTLETFYPLAPTIDLRTCYVYKDNYNFSGFYDGYPFPHAHTLFMYGEYDERQAEKINARGIMFAFANALCRAKLQCGTEEMDLPTPFVTQCVVTNGVNFSYIHVQLNTLQLDSSDGLKNMVWLDADSALYQDMYPPLLKIRRTKGNRKTDRRYIRPLVRRDPELGCRELDVDVFRKFLACYLNGAVN